MDKTDHRHWENREWLLSCDVPKPLLQAATKLGDEEKRLHDLENQGEYYKALQSVTQTAFVGFIKFSQGYPHLYRWGRNWVK